MEFCVCCKCGEMILLDLNITPIGKNRIMIETNPVFCRNCGKPVTLHLECGNASASIDTSGGGSSASASGRSSATVGHNNISVTGDINGGLALT